MRILFVSRGSSGHVLPLVPVARACRDAGHDVLLVVQERHVANARRTALAHVTVPDPPDERWMPLMGRFGTMGIDAANDLMIGEFFAGVDTRATLAATQALVAHWRPDVIVRETWEFASVLAGEAAGIPVARVSLGMTGVDALTARLAAPTLAPLRAELGLPEDPAGARLRHGPFLTTVPTALDDPGPAPAGTRRFAAGPRPARAQGSLRDAGDRRPLVYATFGTVAGGEHLPYFPELHRAVIDALAPLGVRLLMTLGEGPDPAALGPLPDGARVMSWVDQDAVIAEADVVVAHGGFGTTLGALAHGVPLVLLPLFSIDQWINAEAVAAAGAGVMLGGAERTTRRVLALPADATLAGLGAAVARVLDEPSHAASAHAMARAMRALPSAGAAVTELEAMVATPVAV